MPARMRRWSYADLEISGLRRRLWDRCPGLAGPQSRPRPASRADTIACARLATPSLEKIVLT